MKDTEEIKSVKRHLSFIKVAILSLVLILIAGTSGYVFGLMLSPGEETFLAKFQRMLAYNSFDEILKYITIEDCSMDVSRENLEPYFEYLKEVPSRKKALIKELSGPVRSNTTALLKSEKSKWHTKYLVELRPVQLTLSTPCKGTELYLDGKLLAVSDSDNFSKVIEPLIPGIHKLEAVFTNEYGRSFISERVLAISMENQASLDMKLWKFNVDSNYEDAYVYLNGNNTNIQIKDFKDGGPFHNGNTVKVYVKKKFPWGEIKSRECEVNIMSRIRLDIDPLTQELRNQLAASCRTFYECLFRELSHDNQVNINTAAVEFQRKIFSSLVHENSVIKENYTLVNIQCEPQTVSIQRNVGSFSSRANIRISYKSVTNFLGIALPGTLKISVRDFQTILTYDESKDNWIVTDITEKQ